MSATKSLLKISIGLVALAACVTLIKPLTQFIPLLVEFEFDANFTALDVARSIHSRIISSSEPSSLQLVKSSGSLPVNSTLILAGKDKGLDSDSVPTDAKHLSTAAEAVPGNFSGNPGLPAGPGAVQPEKHGNLPVATSALCVRMYACMFLHSYRCKNIPPSHIQAEPEAFK